MRQKPLIKLTKRRKKTIGATAKIIEIDGPKNNLIWLQKLISKA